MLAIGQNSLDRVCRVERLPQLTQKARLIDSRELPGGQIATAALACRRLGLRVSYVGSVGDDGAADAALAPLVRAGVDVAGVKRVAGAPTQLAVVLVEEGSGERTVLWHRDPRLRLTPRDLDRSRVESARAVLLDAGDPELALWVADVAKGAGVAVVLDVDERSPESERLLGRIDFPIVSQEFAESLSETGSALEGLEQVRARGGRMAVVTLGEAGAVAAWGDQRFECPAFQVEARDTTGAGDVFRAAFAWALLEGFGPRQVVRAAAAAAALNCRALGAQGGLPDRPELEAFLGSGQPRRASRGG